MSCGPARAWLPEGRVMPKGITRFPWRPSPQPHAQVEAVSCCNEFVTLLRLFPLGAGWPFAAVWIHRRTVIGLLLANVGGHARCMPHPDKPLHLLWSGRNKFARSARHWELHVTCLWDRTKRVSVFSGSSPPRDSQAQSMILRLQFSLQKQGNPSSMRGRRAGWLSTRDLALIPALPGKCYVISRKLLHLSEPHVLHLLQIITPPCFVEKTKWKMLASPRAWVNRQ